MTYRSILVHLDDHARTTHRLNVAIALAKRFDATLIGMYVQPTYEFYPFVGEMLPPDFVRQSMEQRLDAQRAAESSFGEAASAAGVTRLEFRAPAGDAYHVATIHARYADLAVLGQPEREAFDYAFANDLAHSVLMGSGRPVLLVPYAGGIETLGERVLIAWKDTREAARAVRDACPLLVAASFRQAVTVVPHDDEPIEEFVAENELRKFLALHDIQTDVKRIVAPDASAGETVLSQAADVSADLIVMGGYSHRRIRELIWGGMTRTMLKTMTVPVLMSH